jgi:hypothetical protein
VALSAGTGYIAATVLVFATGVDHTMNARILRSLGTSAGVAVPTLCTVAFGSAAAGFLAGGMWSAVAGTIAWITFSRASLAPSAVTV